MSHVNGESSLDTDRLEVAKAELSAVAQMTQAMAEERKGDVLALLALLRMLEACHKEIRDGLFQEAFPTNRQRLYQLLRDIETQGGWPYVPRMKLQQFLRQVEASSEEPMQDDSPDKSREQ